MFRIEAAHNPNIAGERRFQGAEISTVPPECIALGIERARRVDPGMNEQC